MNKADKSVLPDLPVIDGVLVKHVPDAPGYAASDDGRVWSCRTPQGIVGLWRQLATPLLGRYRGVMLQINRANTRKHIHRLVLEVFVGPCPAGMEALHKDGDKYNNNLSNLRWGTHYENIMDACRHGVGVYRLTLSKVAEIRELRAKGMSQGKVASMFGVSQGAISHIDQGRTWRR